MKKMSKELEEIKTLRGFNQVELNNDKNINKSLDVIEQALQELQAIKSAEPSEALDKFDYIGNDIKFAYDDDYVSYDYTDDVEYIKNTLIKAQEQEKVLSIIKEKNVDIKFFKRCKTVEEYNDYCDEFDGEKPLVQEEFDTLKRWQKIERVKKQ